MKFDLTRFDPRKLPWRAWTSGIGARLAPAQRFLVTNRNAVISTSLALLIGLWGGAVMAQGGACGPGSDRQERGGAADNLSERSAVEDFVRDYGIPVIAVATLADLLDYLNSDADPSLAEHVDSVAAYRRRYGV